ncbi:MAG: dTDP-glucose 4,6-dehydratase [Promethearchaeota archaeon]
MVVLVTGGTGFIGRWVVKKLLDNNKKVVVIDNLKNSSIENLNEFKEDKNFIDVIIDDIRNKTLIEKIYEKYKISNCIHLAAQIDVQESIEHPDRAFENNVIGTYNILEAATKTNSKVVLIGTCLVYDVADANTAISESYRIIPRSPYAGSKIAAEQLAFSYYHGLGLPIVILRPFNTYGPYQKTNMEGGVISIFVNHKIRGEKLKIFGDGTQTRDFLYVEDCAEFIVNASENENCIGEVINAGSGEDISINDLAKLIVGDETLIEHVKHHHPQSEIMKLVCNNSKAKKILNWEPKTSIKEGIQKLEIWLKNFERQNNGKTCN